jgi:hypothetical protein
MVDRYHLVLALVALAVGALIAAVDHWARRVAEQDRVTGAIVARTWASAGLAAALLGGWLSPRAAPWWAAAALVVAFADRPSRPHPMGALTPVLVLVGLAGVWAAVPDTEPAVASAGVLVPVALVRWRSDRPPGPAGSWALGVVLAGAVWVGSAGRGAALAAACALGLTVVAPLVFGWGRAVRGNARRLLFAAHVAVVLLVPRAVMLRSTATATVVAVGASLGLIVLSLVVRRRSARGGGDGTSTA